MANGGEICGICDAGASYKHRTSPVQLELSGDPLGQVTERSNEQLLSDLAAASGFLAMGDDLRCMSAVTLTRMRTEILDAAASLARRWAVDGTT